MPQQQDFAASPDKACELSARACTEPLERVLSTYRHHLKRLCCELISLFAKVSSKQAQRGLISNFDFNEELRS